MRSTHSDYVKVTVVLQRSISYISNMAHDPPIMILNHRKVPPPDLCKRTFRQEGFFVSACFIKTIEIITCSSKLTAKRSRRLVAGNWSKPIRNMTNSVKKSVNSEFSDLEEMHAYAWRLIIRGTVDKKSPARHPTFGTNGLSGKPELRTVVLRHADQKAANLEVHTDVASKKVEELRLNPYVGMHIWFPKNKLQVRIKAISEIKIGNEVKEQWEKVPNEARISYGTLPTPGTIIQTSFAYEKPAKFERFCLVKVNIEEMDLTHLGTRHTRALFARESNWSGTWLAP